MDRRLFLVSATLLGAAAALVGPVRALIHPAVPAGTRRVIVGAPGADEGALGLLGGLPFGPEPEAVQAWLRTAEGRDLWRDAFGAAGLEARPVALEPAPGPTMPPGWPDLPALSGCRVTAPWPLRTLWQRLGAAPAGPEAAADIVDPGPAPGPWRGFGPRCRIVAEVRPLGSGPALVSSGSPPPVTDGRGATSQPLPAEVLVAAGGAWSALRADLLNHPDPLHRRLAAALLTLPRPTEDLSALWPWETAATRASVARPSQAL
ncbi:tat (twin-arginine translocation) pathway signalsequence domain-containing protein [Rhodospirillum centenum]|uniref:Tat (Twin-arginine translocation) pathway signalsequence domain protein n=1 Tax=Rhodospirillum centenum (strain ATCC 51521 / SW) TaxID=414684 RepID=B6IMV3_RHOCS|nr:tat (twin-arginine translocation) pathway signalsequence domain-containing protein [Rhodospirillum centenum]ACI98769.1 tat (twin-arginine translocation) pathway signalsequence domain protein [Rhodospirillum centenum SW]